MPDTADVNINLEVDEKVGRNNCRNGKTTWDLPLNVSIDVSKKVLKTQVLKSIRNSQMDYDNRYNVFGNHLSWNGFS